MYVVKAAKTMFIWKICTFNVDEIDTKVAKFCKYQKEKENFDLLNWLKWCFLLIANHFFRNISFSQNDFLGLISYWTIKLCKVKTEILPNKTKT